MNHQYSNVKRVMISLNLTPIQLRVCCMMHVVMKNMNKRNVDAEKQNVKKRRRDEVVPTAEEEEADRLKAEEEAAKNKAESDDDPELRGKTWEEKLAILEKSDESDLELIRNSRK